MKTLPKITLEDNLFIVNLTSRLPLADGIKIESPTDLLSDGLSLSKVVSNKEDKRRLARNQRTAQVGIVRCRNREAQGGEHQFVQQDVERQHGRDSSQACSLGDHQGQGIREPSRDRDKQQERRRGQFIA